MRYRGIRAARRFARDDSGVAAIEFAILLPVVLALAFSIFEAGWIMAQSVMLDRAVSRSSRALQIGDRSISYADLKRSICREAVILRDCESALRVEMTAINTVSDFPTSQASCVDRSVKIDPVTSYSSGKSSELIFVRTCYVLDPIVPGMGLGLSLPKDGTGGVRLTTAFAFVNEPI